MPNTRPVSPHEKKFAQRMGSGRFNVTGAQIAKQRQNRRPKPGYKPPVTRMMESSGRATREPGQEQPRSRPRPQ